MKYFLSVITLVALLVPQLVGAVYNPTGGGTYRLQTSVGTADTSIRLSSFKEPVSNNKYTMSYLNSDLECGTLDPQTTRSEFISFTGITQNSDGTAVLTGVTRGLGRSYPYTASSTLRQTHAGQSIFILSDAPCLFNQYGIKQNDETLTGYWNVPTPLATNNIASKSYVDALVNGGTVSNDRVVVAGTAGETVSAGQIVALRKSDGEWYLADNDTPSFLVDSILGIAQGAGTNGNAITGGVLIAGLDSNQSGLTAGQRYFISGTAGALTTSTTTKMVGQARSTTNLYVAFQNANPIYFAGVGYTFPSTQGASSTALLNDGSGSLTWNGINQLLTASSSPIIGAASTTVLTATIPANSFSSNAVMKASLPGVMVTGRAGGNLVIEAGYGTGTTTLNYQFPAVGAVNAVYTGELNFTSAALSASSQKNQIAFNLGKINGSSLLASSTLLMATSSTAVDSTQQRALNIIMYIDGSGGQVDTFTGFLEMLRK